MSIRFLDRDGTFTMEKPENNSYLYFPIAGEKGLKSSLTPNLGGDSKLDQNAFLLEPVSSENLHNNRSTRNFWCHVEGVGCWSAVGSSAEAESAKFTDDQEDSRLTAGLMWHQVERKSEKFGLAAKVTSFVPLAHNVELMAVELTNESTSCAVTFTPTAVIPIYGRSADNIRDHRHVTSLLHRVHTTEHGILVKPTLSFDERGHQRNHVTYFVCGSTGDGKAPVSFFPLVENLLGEGGTYTHPRAVLENKAGVPAGTDWQGSEAVGGLRFETVTLEPGETAVYTILLGATEDQAEIDEAVNAYGTAEQVSKALEEVKAYWQEQVNVRYHTGSEEFDNFMRWVSFQPFLRRIYGCSFLPHHDYGKGGRGWRDLWQDCLALLIMNPDGVRQMILDNFGGVRMDGTNATIIGQKQGEFVADRNNITRVWMDHGVWPFLTTKLYIDQTGDVEVLKEEVTYFKDRQILRGTGIDQDWNDEYGKTQKTESGQVYKGSVLEHLLLQNLCAFYEVGEHNHIRLRGADWNDALDMAEQRGESVAFTCAYAGNLRDLAAYLKLLAEKTGMETVELAEEMELLLADDPALYDSVEEKNALLLKYAAQCRHNISGGKRSVSVEALAENLEHKAEWIMSHVRKTEWISDGEDGGWFNSYYDNSGNAVEGVFDSNVRMMLTGQVFAIMSKTAGEEQTAAICRSADRYLYEKEVGGYRLNTDFHEEKFDLGRMFGFAYGEKENGAVFSHMTVMYANALYSRGFAREGYKALQTLADTALNEEVSRIYPGIPEYFNANGRGMYHYLTGAASWYMLTMITQVFGVHGEAGDLVIEPRLVDEQFDEKGCASISLPFGHKKFRIVYSKLCTQDTVDASFVSVLCDGESVPFDAHRASISKKTLDAMDDSIHEIRIVLA